MPADTNEGNTIAVDNQRIAACAAPCPGGRGDANCYGGINFFDIDPMLACLFSGCPACP